MKRKYSILALGIFAGILLFLYRKWFGATPLSAGDWSYHFSEEVRNFFLLPTSWMYWLHWGLGANGVFLTGLQTYFLTTARIFQTVTGLSWLWYERIVWYIPFLFVGMYASLTLIRTVFPDRDNFWVLTPIIFLTNTYALMLTGGGQMGVAMAYALGPLVLAHFIRLYRSVASKVPERKIYRQSILTGVALSLMILFDSRIVYVLTLGTVTYWLVAMMYEKNFGIKYIYFFGIPFFIAGFVHMFWALPLVVFHVQPIESLGATYSSIASAKFFSFSDFSHALALLHPNWPENLFGKVYFLQPEFLVIPLLAWGAFVCIREKKNMREVVELVSFGFIATVGIFLAKGAHDPAGNFYLWLFAHVPGFNAFRDPTKFYLLIIIVYSVFIPVTLENLRNSLRRLPHATTMLTVLFLAMWFFTIRQFVLGQLTGTFKPHSVPHDYEILKDMINKPEYFRTVWVPHVQRYGLVTDTHPGIDLGSLFETGSPSAILAWLDDPGAAKQLARWSVKYVILPFDSQGEIFTDDRKYSAAVRNQYQTSLDRNTYLKKRLVDGIENISVYETPSFNDHLWLETDAKGAMVSWKMKFPTTYMLSLSGLTKPTKLVFSETYDANWKIRSVDGVVKSQKTEDGLNSFEFSASANGPATLEYAPQTFMWYGGGISLAAITGIVVALIIL